MNLVVYRHRILLILFLILAINACREAANTPNDLVLYNGKIWTGNEQMPMAGWIALADGEIVQLGANGETVPEAEKRIDLKGQLAVPGFNDSHVHFASAGALLLGVNLLAVNDENSFVEEIQQATERLPSISTHPGKGGSQLPHQFQSVSINCL